MREPEGPFGEFPQYYGPRAEREVIQVDAITHRRDAIFHTIVGGGMEHLILGEIPREASMLEHLQRSFPSVRDVRLTRGARAATSGNQNRQNERGRTKEYRPWPRLAPIYDIKQVVVVDMDVDIDDPNEIEMGS